ncbi:MAG TPA: Rieske 2Fe-2S domain-containing protein [Candidatus Binatia bacterium]
MLSEEQNRLLVETGTGTPCGALLRSYWQPAALSEELGVDPLPVTLLGEELVMFRRSGGEPALIGRHCSHRGADLSYGRVEDGGLRCMYHGWLYDGRGSCLDQPGERGGGEYRDGVRHPAYPCVERAGVVFAYLGPGQPPFLPDYGFLSAPGEHLWVRKYYHECNYLQANEGNIDPVHLSFLHRVLDDTGLDRAKPVRGTDAAVDNLYGVDLAPALEVEVADFGLRICSLRRISADRHYLRVSNFIYPNLSAFPGETGADGYSVHWHVPIDDTRHWKFAFAYNREKALSAEFRRRDQSAVTADHRFLRNRSNRYLQDREAMKTKTYSGLGLHFQSHDAYATESQGFVQDRTREHLVSSDKAIVAARKLLESAIRQVQAGREAPHVVRSPSQNKFPHLVVLSEMIPAAADWHDAARKAAGGQ